ncbi:MAG: CheB methylesterase domain-containing protein [Sulfurospirillaceae bacterium]|nr:CheB methylesterase domain-containing protein [Sulfurospirillaceae bacterium]
MKQKIVLIGASTGGPGHLKKILSAMQQPFSMPIIIAQHMNSTFIPSFINQFKSELSFPVHAIDTSIELKTSEIFICSTNSRLKKTSFSLHIEPIQNLETPYNPSVDTLFFSAVEYCKECDILAILLTGIGQDGAMGLSELQKNGATCIAENEESAIVFGMPKRAVEINPLIKAMHLNDIINTIKLFGAS